VSCELCVMCAALLCCMLYHRIYLTVFIVSLKCITIIISHSILSVSPSRQTWGLTCRVHQLLTRGDWSAGSLVPLTEPNDDVQSRRMNTCVTSNALFTQMNPSLMDEEVQQQIFDHLFGRFRKAVLHRVSHSADLNRNSEILASVFIELYRTVHGDLKTSEYRLFAKDFEYSAQKVLPGFTSDDLQKLFTYLDGDQDGKISVEEFVFGIKVNHIPLMHCSGARLNIFSNPLPSGTYILN
jgi:hypothetical protein